PVRLGELVALTAPQAHCSTCLRWLQVVLAERAQAQSIVVFRSRVVPPRLDPALWSPDDGARLRRAAGGASAPRAAGRRRRPARGAAEAARAVAGPGGPGGRGRGAARGAAGALADRPPRQEGLSAVG
ncbi:unnamed protein product, partial [Prorocentrum cordatum]